MAVLYAWRESRGVLSASSTLSATLATRPCNLFLAAAVHDGSDTLTLICRSGCLHSSSRYLSPPHKFPPSRQKCCASSGKPSSPEERQPRKGSERFWPTQWRATSTR